jgi:sortase A
VYSEDGRHEFNYAEIPASVRSDLREQLNEPRRTAELPANQPSDPILVEIPTLEKRVSVFKGDDWETLRQGVGHHIGSGTPGSPYNMVLTAHNDIYGEHFRYIYQLEEGDTVRVQARNGQWHTYQVKDSRQVEPTDLEVLDPYLGPVVTLITCYPYQVNSHRWVVHAELVQ